MTNYGASGAAAMHGISASYDDTDMYTQSISSSPDIVVIMFGTNDSAAWKDEATFAADYEKLISTYEALDSKPRVPLHAAGTASGKSQRGQRVESAAG